MFYIEQTRKSDCKLHTERSTFDLPNWFNKDALDFIFGHKIGTCTIIKPEHAIKIKSHVRNLTFDFDNYDYILWRKPKT